MPELPEVEAARRALEDHCVGKRIRKSTVADDPKVIDGVSPKDFEAALAGKTIVGAHRKGKNMWLELDSPPFPTFQFGMAGAVYIKGVAVTKYKRSAVKDTDEWPSKYSKLFVQLDDGLEFSFTDKRRFAKVRLLDKPVSMPPISELGPDALKEPMTEDEFHNALSKKKIGIKALLLDQSFISGIGNWMADEVLYQARIHPLQSASSMSKEICGTLLKSITEVIENAIQVGADSSQFPNGWIYHSREKKPGKAFVDGKKIDFINAGGRTTAYVPELQKLTGSQAVKEASKPKANTKGSEESENEDEPNKQIATKRGKTNRAKKPSSKTKAHASIDESGDENDEADDTSVQRTKGTAKSKTKGENENNGQHRQTRGKSAPAKRKLKESDDELNKSDSSGSDGGDNEDEEVQVGKNGKQSKAGASSKKKAASTNQKGRQKKKAK